MSLHTQYTTLCFKYVYSIKSRDPFFCLYQHLWQGGAMSADVSPAIYEPRHRGSAQGFYKLTAEDVPITHDPML